MDWICTQIFGKRMVKSHSTAPKVVKLYHLKQRQTTPTMPPNIVYTAIYPNSAYWKVFIQCECITMFRWFCKKNGTVFGLAILHDPYGPCKTNRGLKTWRATLLEDGYAGYAGAVWSIFETVMLFCLTHHLTSWKLTASPWRRWFSYGGM